ncbi:membrane transporter [Stachybotrys elegans]|uniref:Membrane transporter n=1 Tax=Stachybotrys elegans TaxID=80388 RepID=A0A8K0WJI4_9HYPO|nr:membrane transporter [Stachybotrys elegans]
MASHPKLSKIDGEVELGSSTDARDVSPDPKHPDYPTHQKADSGEDILGGQGLDPVLTTKLRLLNDAIDEIGWTPYHWRLFFLAGFGYAVDSMVILIKSATLPAITNEFNPSYSKALLVANNVGLIVGALFWGLSADMIGRKWAFNLSLIICSIFGLAAGAAPNYVSVCTFAALLAFGAGGNLVLDVTVFLEYLPSNKQHVLTLLAGWWGIGQTFTGLMAWAFLPRYSCESTNTCTRANNMGWRYVYWTCCSVVFVMSLLRVFIVRLNETPKYRLADGKDEEAFEIVQKLSIKYNRPISLTLEKLQACGEIAIADNHAKHHISLSEILLHVRGLFQTRLLARSTLLIWASWTLIGLAYPLFQVFLPTYLASRGAQFGQLSPDITWRNYAIANVCSIFGPLAAGVMAATVLGRRYTMVIGALLTMSFFWAYSQVKSNEANVAFTCVVNFTLNIYYATLYAYTPEVLPTAHRSTGNGIAVGCNRVMGLVSTIVGSFVDLNTPVPIYICAALYVAMAGVAILFPFEPRGQRSS